MPRKARQPAAQKLTNKAHPQLLRRQQASEYLQEVWGLQRATTTLAKDAVQGVGPPFHYIEDYPYYLPKELDAWVKSLLSKPTRLTRKRHNGHQQQERTSTALLHLPCTPNERGTA
jgi:hypothetical protein